MEKNSDSEKRNTYYLPMKIRRFAEMGSQSERIRLAELKEKYDSKNPAVPALSQSEKEHLTYLRVLNEYNNLKEKRNLNRRYGSIAIIISAVLLLALMFSLESKIELLVIWIAIILYCVAVLIRTEYKYHCFKEYLGIADEFDYYEMESAENQEELIQKNTVKLTKENSHEKHTEDIQA